MALLVGWRRLLAEPWLDGMANATKPFGWAQLGQLPSVSGAGEGPRKVRNAESWHHVKPSISCTKVAAASSSCQFVSLGIGSCLRFELQRVSA